MIKCNMSLKGFLLMTRNATGVKHITKHKDGAILEHLDGNKMLVIIK